MHTIHTNARLSGINPGNPFSMSALAPRKTKLMAQYIWKLELKLHGWTIDPTGINN